MVVREVGERREREGWSRIIVEKPFGHDLAVGARAEPRSCKRWFDEDEVFRIDHYLGKETVQNLLALRFANGIFEPIWNRQMRRPRPDHRRGVDGDRGTRAGYYERAGAIRDIFQNHLLQLLALTAMEPPIDFTADAVRNEKVKVLRAMHTPGPEVRRARASTGAAGSRARRSPRYREEPGVDPALDDGDVRRRQALRRQLALGRHALLRPRRQAAGAARDDDRDPVQAGAASAVRGDRRRRAPAERPPDPRPAGRGRLARDRREGARARACRSAPCTWTSSTAARSARACPRRTSG